MATIDVYTPEDIQASKLTQTICNAEFKRKHNHYSEILTFLKSRLCCKLINVKLNLSLSQKITCIGANFFQVSTLG